MMTNDDHNEKTKHYEVALNILGAVSDAGFGLLPFESNQAMNEFGARAGNVTPETAQKIWRAMVCAAASEWGENLRDPFSLFDLLQDMPRDKN